MTSIIVILVCYSLTSFAVCIEWLVFEVGVPGALAKCNTKTMLNCAIFRIKILLVIFAAVPSLVDKVNTVVNYHIFLTSQVQTLKGIPPHVHVDKEILHNKKVSDCCGLPKEYYSMK